MKLFCSDNLRQIILDKFMKLSKNSFLMEYFGTYFLKFSGETIKNSFFGG